MKTCRISNENGVIAERVQIADRFFSRFRGLQGRKAMEENEGLLIRPCRRIHTFNMHFDLDVLFLSKTGTVIHIIEFLERGLVSPFIRHGHEVIELKGGMVNAKHIRIGDVIQFNRQY
jgi:uncharacterized membrane protein (UPF0127 family)